MLMRFNLALLLRLMMEVDGLGHFVESGVICDTFGNLFNNKDFRFMPVWLWKFLNVNNSRQSSCIRVLIGHAVAHDACKIETFGVDFITLSVDRRFFIKFLEWGDFRNWFNFNLLSGGFTGDFVSRPEFSRNLVSCLVGLLCYIIDSLCCGSYGRWLFCKSAGRSFKSCLCGRLRNIKCHRDWNAVGVNFAIIIE